MKRHISGPSRELLSRAGLSPNDVDAAIETLVSDKAGALLRKHHPLVQRIERTTGINVVQIARKSRYLLVEIEQHGSVPPWLYRERTPRSCNFSCKGELPRTIEVALQGVLLEKLVIPTAAMGKTTIDHVGRTGDGWLSVDVVPTWHPF